MRFAVALILLVLSAAKSMADVTVYHETWSGGAWPSAPVIPTLTGSAWVGTSNMVVTSGVGASGGYGIKITTQAQQDATTNFGDASVTTTSAGNVRLSMRCRLNQNGVSGNGMQICGGVRGFQHGSTYWYGFDFATGYGGSGACDIIKYINGVRTIITSPTFTVTDTDYYTVMYTASANSQSIKVQRFSDSKYVAPGGTFTTSAVDFTTASDTDIPQCAGNLVIESQIQNSGGSYIIVDDLKLESLPGVVTYPPYANELNFQKTYCFDGTPIEQSAGNTFFDPQTGFYYRYSEDMGNATTPTYFSGGTQAGVLTGGVKVYQSRNRTDWSYEGHAFTPPDGNYVIYNRPHVRYRPTTHDYIMYADVWTSPELVGGDIVCMTSSSAKGPFTGRASTGLTGGGDFDVFIEGATAIAYATLGGSTIKAVTLNSSWTLSNSAAVTLSLSGGAREAPCMIKSGSNYILMTSGQNWWVPNSPLYYTSTNSTAVNWSTGVNPFASWANDTNSNGYRTQPVCFWTDQDGSIGFAANRWCTEDLGESLGFYCKPTISGVTMTFSGSATCSGSATTNNAPPLY